MTRIHKQLRRQSLVKPVARPSVAKAHKIKRVSHPSLIDTQHNVPVVKETLLKKNPPLYVKIPLQFFTGYQVYSYLDRRNYGLLSKIAGATVTNLALEKALDSYYE